MASILIRGPLLTQSGYGVHSRQIFKWALSRGHQVSVQLTPWGVTPWYLDFEECNGLVGEIMKRSAEPVYPPEISIQIQLPNEWDPNLCHKNIGITAGIETNICSQQWVAACKAMDHVVVPSKFTKNTFATCGFPDATVVGETFIEECLSDTYEELEELSNLKTKKNFLIFGQLTGMNPEFDRKNTFHAVKWFLETFKKKKDVSLIIKTNSGTNCTMDKRVTSRKLRNYISQLRTPDTKCKVYLLHGYLPSEKIAGLYKSKKLTGIISATRGEGFGLPMIEAAACGLPVVATNWSGHKDFLGKDGLWLPVDYTLKPVVREKIDGNMIVPGAMWATADEKSFKKQILALYKNPAFYKKKAKLLSKNIHNNFAIILRF